MNRNIYMKVAFLTVTLLMSVPLFAQRFPERAMIRSGNKQYEKGNFVESEIGYRRAMEKAPEAKEAVYNLGNALYKQGRFQEAAAAYNQIVKDTVGSGGVEMSHALYNGGNSLFQQKQLEQALEAYKQALRLNPSDQEAKFNLAYTKKLLEENKDKDQNKDQNKDNKDDQQDQNKQDQENKDDQKDQQDQNKDQNKDTKDNNKEQQQEQNSGMNKEEAERMLEAVQMSEDKTRDKMNEKKATAVGKSGKNW